MTVVTPSERSRHAALLIACLVILIWSGWHPYDRLTWLLEVAPVIISLVILVATYRRFPLSNLVYLLLGLHALILMLGGHWTYARMPVFEWLKETFDWQRNYYDRLGHIAQGFIPAILTRELLLRTSPLRPGKWLFTLVITSTLGISAAYELFEWLAASALGQGADEFLATQGDSWDTQWDMFLALSGATAAMLVLPRLHDHSLRIRGFVPPSSQ